MNETYNSGSVLLVNGLIFEHDWKMNTKQRVCVVLDDASAESPITVVPLSESTYETNVVIIEPDDENGLDRASHAVCDQRTTVNSAQVVRLIGEIHSDDLKDIRSRLR